jgi:hypothetical protein|tara:strand:- start:2935 stop:3396 length:462 start_codon:yes stop_codon:yes gene_type:complete
MTKEQFKNIIDLFNETYPKQPNLTTAQQLMFWVSLQQYDVDAVMGAFISHTNDKELGQWKPQVPVNLTRYLQKSDVDIRSTFNSFFQHKEVTDSLALKIWSQMGGNKMLRMTTRETDKKEEIFVNLYRQSKIGSDYDGLPMDIKTKLIGVIKK